METKYYTHDGKEQRGPFSYNELISFKEKNLMVWYDGLETWKPLNTLFKVKKGTLPNQKNRLCNHLAIAITILALSNFFGFYCNHTRDEFWTTIGLTIEKGVVLTMIVYLIGFSYLFFAITKIDHKKLKVFMMAACIIIILIRINYVYESYLALLSSDAYSTTLPDEINLNKSASANTEIKTVDSTGSDNNDHGYLSLVDGSENLIDVKYDILAYDPSIKQRLSAPLKLDILSDLINSTTMKRIEYSDTWFPEKINFSDGSKKGLIHVSITGHTKDLNGKEIGLYYSYECKEILNDHFEIINRSAD